MGGGSEMGRVLVVVVMVGAGGVVGVKSSISLSLSLSQLAAYTWPSSGWPAFIMHATVSVYDEVINAFGYRAIPPICSLSSLQQGPESHMYSMEIQL